MHEFDFINRPKELLTPEVVALLTRLHECRGRQELFIEAEPDVLTALLEVAKIQSTDASNRIEGIYTSDERLKAIVQEKVQPRNRNEEEISGYRDVLATIHESYEHITPRPNSILQLHRDLYSFSSSAVGGVYKNSDNIIAEKHADGTETVRFRPVPAFQTADAMLNLCTRYNDAIKAATYNPLILMPIFILDFLCIHPFNDGNGRMSRLLTLLLLYRAGFIVGKYISIEMLIEKSKDSYYEALQASSQDWHEDRNNYLPFLKYMLGVMDGRGRAKDNIWIERFCKTIKYEYIYIQPEENGADLFFGIKRFIDNYNYHRRHQGINRTVPSKLYIHQAAWS